MCAWGRGEKAVDKGISTRVFLHRAVMESMFRMTLLFVSIVATDDEFSSFLSSWTAANDEYYGDGCGRGN